MAWSSEDQNPTTSPSAAYGQTNYATALNQAAYYNPLGGGSSSTGMATTAAAPTGGETNYAARLNAVAPVQEAQTTRSALEKSATPQPAVGTRAAREIQPWGGGGSRFEIAGKAASRGIGKVDNALVDIMQKAAAESPYNVQVFSGYRPGDKRQHGRGNAVDIALVDPYSGEALANYQSAETFPQYETFARKAYEIAQRDYPDLAENFRWGGYFSGGRGKYGATDAMHFDVNSGASMLGGSFEGGLTPEQQRRVDRMGGGRTQWAGLRPGVTAVPPETRYADNPFGVEGGGGQAVMAGGNMPTPRQNPRGQPRMGTQGARETATAYAPPPEAMEAPFDAVIGGNRRPQPAAPRMRPQRDTLTPAPAAEAAPAQSGAYTVQRGDNLSAIAQRTLGDPNRWREIAAANGIRDPNVIQPGQQLVIPGVAAAPARRQPANVPQPRPRSSREVAMPTPRPRPERGANVPSPRMRPQPSSPTTRPPAATREFWNERGLGSRGTPETQMSIDRSGARSAPRATPEFWNSIGLGPRGNAETQMSIDRSQRPAGPGMDTSGLIREPTAQERALQGQPMRLPTGAQPMDPEVARQIRRTPTVIRDPQNPAGGASTADLRGGIRGDRLVEPRRDIETAMAEAEIMLGGKSTYPQNESLEATRERMWEQWQPGQPFPMPTPDEYPARFNAEGYYPVDQSTYKSPANRRGFPQETHWIHRLPQAPKKDYSAPQPDPDFSNPSIAMGGARQIRRTPVVIQDQRGQDSIRGGAGNDRLGSGQRYFISGQWQSADDLARNVNDAYNQWEGRNATPEEIDKLVGQTIRNYNEGMNALESPDIMEGPDAPMREIPMSSLPQGPPSFVAGNGARIWIG